MDNITVGGVTLHSPLLNAAGMIILYLLLRKQWHTLRK